MPRVISRGLVLSWFEMDIVVLPGEDVASITCRTSRRLVMKMVKIYFICISQLELCWQDIFMRKHILWQILNNVGPGVKLDCAPHRVHLVRLCLWPRDMGLVLFIPGVAKGGGNDIICPVPYVLRLRVTAR